MSSFAIILLQAIINGLFIGGLYGAISMGLSLIFGVMKLVNFAHGEFLMLAMYVTYWFVVYMGTSPLVSLVVSIPLLFAIGYLFEALMLSRTLPLGDLPEILLTVGLSIFLQNFAQLLWSSNYQVVPVGYPDISYGLSGVFIALPPLIIFIGSLVAAVILWLILQRTSIGLTMQATAQDITAAKLMGVNTKSAFAISFGLGIAFTAAAGSLLAPTYEIFPTIGSTFILIMFVVVVIGGMGDIRGAYVGGLVLGLISSISSLFVTADLGQVVLFVFFILVLLLRPNGLFGKMTR
ncbi:MAG: branched-chain amino acid ABC transporter permease [Nitrososphaerota archaeon]|nr:branched-chain amino acid ABC transporter permease [Nitrososphaerota archaeon]